MRPFIPLGKIIVPTPGTPVRLTVSVPTSCRSLMIEAWPTNTGKIWVGYYGTMDKSTGVDLLAIIAIPTVNIIGSFSATLPTEYNAFELSDLAIDADIANDGVIVVGVRP